MNDAAQNLELKFEDMGLHVGATMFMRLADNTATSTRYPVEYIGAIRDRSLLVSLPMVNGKGLWMPVGQQYVFHVVEGMYVYAFTASVLRARNNPFPYVHFAYPAHVDARQVRKSYRVRMRQSIPVAGAEGSPRDATLLDLSMTGALLEAPVDTWQVGDKVSLALVLALEEAESQLNLSAAVRNQDAKHGGGQAQGVAHFGVEFAEMPQHDALLLHYYIDHAIATRLR